MQLNERLWQLTQERFGRSPDQCDDHQLYEALLLLTRALAQDRPAPPGDRKLYYFSAEFLTGKLLSNNLLALGLHQPVRELLAGSVTGEELLAEMDAYWAQAFETEGDLLGIHEEEDE